MVCLPVPPLPHIRNCFIINKLQLQLQALAISSVCAVCNIPFPQFFHFLTEAGEYTDAFTLQYIAGHDTIKTTMRMAKSMQGTLQSRQLRRHQRRVRLQPTRPAQGSGSPEL